MTARNPTIATTENNTAIPANGVAVKTRTLKLTKKIAETIRTIQTEGWILVIPSHGKWKVRKYGYERASGVYTELETAIIAAKKLGRSIPNASIFVRDRNADTFQTIRE